MARKEDTVTGGKRTIDELRADLSRQEQALEQALANVRRARAVLDEAVGVLPITKGAQMIDRIVFYLHQAGRPFSRPELIQALVDAGAGAGREDSAVQIAKSIDYHTIDKRVKKHRLKIVHELIGLAEWQAEKFQTSGT